MQELEAAGHSVFDVLISLSTQGEAVNKNKLLKLTGLDGLNCQARATRKQPDANRIQTEIAVFETVRVQKDR